MAQVAQGNKVLQRVVRVWFPRAVPVNVMQGKRAVSAATQVATMAVSIENRISRPRAIERCVAIANAQFQVIRTRGSVGQRGRFAVHAQPSISLPLPHATTSLASNLLLPLMRQAVPVPLRHLGARSAKDETFSVAITPTSDALPVCGPSVSRSDGTLPRLCQAPRAVDAPILIRHLSASLTQTSRKPRRLSLFDRLRTLAHANLLTESIAVAVRPVP